MIKYTDVKVGDTLFTNGESIVKEIDSAKNIVYFTDGMQTSYSGLSHFHKLVKGDDLIEIERVCEVDMYLHDNTYIPCNVGSRACRDCPKHVVLEARAMEKFKAENPKTYESIKEEARDSVGQLIEKLKEANR